MPIWESGSVLGSRDKKVNRIRHGLFLPGTNILLTEKHMNYGIIQMSLTIHWGEGRGGEKRGGDRRRRKEPCSKSERPTTGFLWRMEELLSGEK